VNRGVIVSPESHRFLAEEFIELPGIDPVASGFGGDLAKRKAMLREADRLLANQVPELLSSRNAGIEDYFFPVAAAFDDGADEAFPFLGVVQQILEICHGTLAPSRLPEP